MENTKSNDKNVSESNDKNVSESNTETKKENNNICKSTVNIDNSSNASNGIGFITFSFIGGVKNCHASTTNIARVFSLYQLDENNKRTEIIKKINFKMNGTYSISVDFPFTVFEYDSSYMYGINKEGTSITDEMGDILHILEPIINTRCFKVYENDNKSFPGALCY